MGPPSDVKGGIRVCHTAHPHPTPSSPAPHPLALGRMTLSLCASLPQKMAVSEVGAVGQERNCRFQDGVQNAWGWTSTWNLLTVSPGVWSCVGMGARQRAQATLKIPLLADWPPSGHQALTTQGVCLTPPHPALSDQQRDFRLQPS